jgi:hypothetical protein
LVNWFKKKFEQVNGLALFTLHRHPERNRAMMKTFEAIGEVIRDPRHPFRKTEHQPKKALKNRYERRKIKEYLHMADWLAEELA